MPGLNLPPIAASHPLIAGGAGGTITGAIGTGGANATTQSLAANQPFISTTGGGAQAVINALNANNSARRSALADNMPMPSQTIYTINSIAGSGAVGIIGYFLNEDLLSETPSNNGSGADSVIVTYNDGFNGNLLSQISLMYGLQGLPYKQFQLTFTDNATGEQDKASLSAANPRKISYNGDTTNETQLLALASAGNPAYYQAGFLIIDIDFRMRRNEQILLNVPAGKTATMVLVPSTM